MNEEEIFLSSRLSISKVNHLPNDERREKKKKEQQRENRKMQRWMKNLEDREKEILRLRIVSQLLRFSSGDPPF